MIIMHAPGAASRVCARSRGHAQPCPLPQTEDAAPAGGRGMRVDAEVEGLRRSLEEREAAATEVANAAGQRAAVLEAEVEGLRRSLEEREAAAAEAASVAAGRGVELEGEVEGLRRSLEEHEAVAAETATPEFVVDPSPCVIPPLSLSRPIRFCNCKTLRVSIRAPFFLDGSFPSQLLTPHGM
eukprot:gene12961-biopygen9060